MRVLFISQYSGLGGAQKSLINLICGLRQFGVESFVLIPKKGIAEAEFKRLNIPYSIIRYASMRVFSKNKIRNWLEYLIRRPLNLIQAIRLKKKIHGKFDVIHSNSSLVFLGHDLKKVLNVPLVWHLREYGDSDYKMYYLNNMQSIRNKFLYADCVVTISDAMDKHYKKTITSDAKYKRIYDEVDANGFIRANHNNTRIKICIVGGVSPAKNQIECIKAITYLKDLDFQLDIIGNCSPDYKAYLEEYIKKEGISDKVRLLGHKDNIPSILCQYDIGITPSINEGFGRVTIEYMISNLAVIASNTGANPELLSDNKYGLLYNLGVPQHLAEKLRMLISDKQLLLSTAERGNKHAINTFCSGKNTQQIFKLYQQLVLKK